MRINTDAKSIKWMCDNGMADQVSAEIDRLEGVARQNQESEDLYKKENLELTRRCRELEERLRHEINQAALAKVGYDMFVRRVEDGSRDKAISESYDIQFRENWDRRNHIREYDKLNTELQVAWGQLNNGLIQTPHCILNERVNACVNKLRD